MTLKADRSLHRVESTYLNQFESHALHRHLVYVYFICRAQRCYVLTYTCLCIRHRPSIDIACVVHVLK